MPDDDETARVRLAIVEAMGAFLREVADDMEGGRRPMLSGPEALRQVALEVSAVNEVRDDAWNDWIGSVARGLGIDAEMVDADFFAPLYRQGVTANEALSRWYWSR